jgi:hypothetical protein
MNPPLSAFSGGKLASRAARWRVAAALGAAAVIGASAVAVASPARADVFDQTCNTYHSWTVCVSLDDTSGNLAVNAVNSSTAGNHSLWMTVDPGELYSESFYFSAGSWVGFAKYQADAFTEVCGGIDSTEIVCSALT